MFAHVISLAVVEKSWTRPSAKNVNAGFRH